MFQSGVFLTMVDSGKRADFLPERAGRYRTYSIALYIVYDTADVLLTARELQQFVSPTASAQGLPHTIPSSPPSPFYFQLLLIQTVFWPGNKVINQRIVAWDSYQKHLANMAVSRNWTHGCRYRRTPLLRHVMGLLPLTCVDFSPHLFAYFKTWHVWGYFY